MTIIVPKTTGVTVRQEGDRVLLIQNGTLLLDMPYQAALVLAKALHTQGKKAEELANAQNIINDQAILTRLGAGIGLTNNPILLKEAANEAAWNSDLRRYIRPDRAKGIETQEIVGAPRLIQHAPKGNGNNHE